MADRGLPPLPSNIVAQQRKGVPAVPAQEERNIYSLKEFLERLPPGTTADVDGKLMPIQYNPTVQFMFGNVDLDLYCDTPVKCTGLRTFRRDGISGFIGTERDCDYSLHLRFLCVNCGKRAKLYSLLVEYRGDAPVGLTKLAEVPDFGPPTPAKVIKIVGPEKDYYLKGRRCENQGLGIGAFGYYRRVVENQKNRIIDEIIRAAKKIDVPQELIEGLEAAKAETQFSTAIDKIKPGVPQALLIKGQNPLTLLHSALSQGLHAETDEDCLELATSIRVVLDDLTERTTAVLKDSAELDKALGRLMQWKTKKAQPEAK